MFFSVDRNQFGLPALIIINIMFLFGLNVSLWITTFDNANQSVFFFLNKPSFKTYPFCKITSVQYAKKRQSQYNKNLKTVSKIILWLIHMLSINYNQKEYFTGYTIWVHFYYDRWTLTSILWIVMRQSNDNNTQYTCIGNVID